MKTKEDWIALLGTTAIDSSCNGDLNDLGSCNLCIAGTQQVTNRLVRMIKNVTQKTSLQCFYLAILYAAGVVNKFEPKNPNTANCILGLATFTPKTKHNSRWVIEIEGR